VKYFVTGATGFIGGRVARPMRAAGHEGVTLARNPARAGGLGALGGGVRPGDITDRATLREPMTGVDGVFHLAGWNHLGVRDTAAAEPVNVAGTRNVLETMRDLGIPKGVYTSTVTVFGDTHGQLADESYRAGGPWLTVYDRTKWRAHYEVAEPLQRAGLPLVIVQPGPAYGPGDAGVLHDTFVQFLQGKLPMAPARTTLCLAHVDDVAQGHILAMERGTPGESYIIAGPPQTFIEIMALAAQISGIPAPKQHPPRPAQRAGRRDGGGRRGRAAAPDVQRRDAPEHRRRDLPRDEREGAARAGLRPTPPGRGPARNAGGGDGGAADARPRTGLGRDRKDEKE